MMYIYQSIGLSFLKTYSSSVKPKLACRMDKHRSFLSPTKGQKVKNYKGSPWEGVTFAVN